MQLQAIEQQQAEESLWGHTKSSFVNAEHAMTYPSTGAWDAGSIGTR
jgi:hypothetical protein